MTAARPLKPRFVDVAQAVAGCITLAQPAKDPLARVRHMVRSLTDAQREVLTLIDAARGSRECRMYFIVAGGAVKIGVARNPRSRVVELQVGNHEKLRLVLHVAGSVALEDATHLAFDAHRLRGEWFRHTAELDAFIRCAARVAGRRHGLATATRIL